MKKLLNEQIAVSESKPIRARTFDYPCFTYPLHYHSQYELVLIEEGHGTCMIGDNATPYDNGDLLFFGSELPHCMMTSKDSQLEGNGVRGINIQLERNFMKYSFSHYEQFSSIRNLLEEAGRGIKFHCGNRSALMELMKHIPNKHGGEQLIDMLYLLQKLSNTSQRTLVASPEYCISSETSRDTKTEKILSYLQKRYTSRITLPQAASYAAMNASAFCRFFKTRTGKTFRQYITELRIGYACRLLASDRMNISQISDVCGFETISHFNRSFKQVTNMTPTRYREALQDKNPS